MTSIFGDNDYFSYKFPEPQYLGAKYLHRQWIAQFIPPDCNVTLDAFGGSQSIAFMMKQMGKETITNDFLDFCNQTGKALIENQNVTLSSEDADLLFAENSSQGDFHLMADLFSNLFFTPQEAKLLDCFRSNTERLNHPYKKALALAVMCRALTRKVTMGHFAHTQALVYAADPARVKRNRSLVRPIRELFMELRPQYNAAVFNNCRPNKSYNENILDLLPRLRNIDLAYFDPPYCNSHADYQSFYHLLETFVEYWKDKQFVNGVKRYEPKRFCGFDKNNEAVDSFKRLFERAQHIPRWLISYNDRSYPDISTLVNIIRPYKSVNVERKPYANSRGGKGSRAGSSEILLVCSNY